MSNDTSLDSDQKRLGVVLGRFLGLVWKSAPGWMTVNLILILFQGLLPLAGLYLMKRIVDVTASGFTAQNKTQAFHEILLWIALAGGVALLQVLCRSLAELAVESQSQAVTDAVSDTLHAQSIAVDLEYYEDSRYYDALHRAQQEAPYRPARIVGSLTQVGQSGLSLLGISALILSYDWKIALLLFLVALPAALVRISFAHRQFDIERKQTENERRAWYYHWMLTDPSHAKEVRLFNLGSLFRSRFLDLRQGLRRTRLAIYRQRSWGDFLAQAIATVALFGTFATVASQAILGRVSLGSLVMYYQAFQSGLGYLQAVLRGLVGLYEDNLFLTNFYRFLGLVPRIQTQSRPRPVPLEVRHGIGFHGVGFRYPRGSSSVLTGIDLTLRPGEVIALVGENGSGKTTLVKLLCRLYDPSEGDITLEGVPLHLLDPVKWRREISVVFQDYIHYHLTARENVWMGNVDLDPNQARIARAAEQSGVDSLIRSLPLGYDTILGNWFEQGQELSIGEWQKVALARAFLRDSRILVLDEPTSSLDPLSEAAVFEQFRNMVRGRSAILISHRFSTVQMVDCIYVLAAGRIVERGTHQELLSMNGHYAHLFRTQASHYREGIPKEGRHEP